MTTTSRPDLDPATWGEPRTRTVEWHDPARALAATQGRSGKEVFAGMISGEIPAPPISALLGMRLVSAADGDAVFACKPDESMYNPIGMVHGGIACTLLDSATGCAVHTTLPDGMAYTSLEIKVSYQRAVHATGGEIFAHGWVTKPGKRVAFAEADLRDADGKLLASASSTLLIMPVSGGGPGPSGWR
jgi:uncharacterized protein (TIGR00369 family)